MNFAIDFIGTNLASGTKSYNLTFCEILHKLKFNDNVTIFICKSYIRQIDRKKKYKQNIKYIIKPDFLSITFFRILWMQLILPFELRFLDIKTVYSPMNFSPVLAKLLNIKVALCLHSNLPWIYFKLMPGSIIRNYITKKLMEICIYTCDVLIVNSNYAKKEISKILKISKKKIKVVYLHINEIYYLNKYKKNKTKKFFFKENYILSVISCVKYHNIINFLSAYKILLTELNFNIKLILVMQILDKDYFYTIRNYINENFKKKQIILYSNLKKENLLFFYKFAKLYSFTSYSEVFGLTSLEAFSQGVPVAISNRSALKEINAGAALYFNPDNINQIKNTLKKILTNNDLKLRLIKAGQKRLKNFNSKINVKKTIQIITSI
jgi:glycosyltransferase involved in cell wall biosynthesis